MKSMVIAPESKSRGFESRSKPENFSDHFSGSCIRMYNHTYIYLFLLDISYHGIHMIEPSIMSTAQKGPNSHTTVHVTLIAQLGEHCTGNAKVVGSNPVQSLTFFPVIFSAVLWLHLDL